MSLGKVELKKQLQALGCQIKGNYVRKSDIEKIIVADKYDELQDLIAKAKAAIYDLDGFTTRYRKNLEDEQDINVTALKHGISLLVNIIKEMTP